MTEKGRLRNLLYKLLLHLKNKYIKDILALFSLLPTCSIYQENYKSYDIFIL